MRRRVIVGLLLCLMLAGCTQAAVEPTTPLEEAPDVSESVVERVERLMAMRDLDQIFALEDDTDFATALSSALSDWTNFGEDLSVLSEEAQVFYLCNTVELQVNNDGFLGFLFESYGQHAPATVDALETIGAPKTADILRRVIALLPGGVCPEDYTEREDILFSDYDGYSEACDLLDEEFYREPDGGLQSLYVPYARAHRDSFAAPSL